MTYLKAKVPCDCGEAYLGETGCTVETRIKEHKRNVRLKQSEKSAIAEHALDKGHKILFNEIKVLCTTPRYWERIVKEAIKIEVEEKNFNREEGIKLHKAWRPFIRRLKEGNNGIGEKRQEHQQIE
ncbi:hypothetical protein J437_LFUL015199 [Ladona fulva]|uniref:GIY-YIG domain-containing protein n=1 Tax=Ladona fulva TaxID=123851 RepID=A0A8K0P928_LADFU|nr:hypothetical protein J437_LFUL015199 [Ladona fulva]